jgi:hypothetical protein
MRVFDIDSGDEEVKMKRKLYKITAVPTIVVDGRLKWSASLTSHGSAGMTSTGFWRRISHFDQYMPV